MKYRRTVRGSLEKGAIGTVRYAQVTFGYPIMGIERIRNPEQGGGALLDLGNVFHNDPTRFSTE